MRPVFKRSLLKFKPPTIIVDKRGNPSPKRHRNLARSLDPDFSGFPADFNDLPIKTSVNIDGEDITIYALKREHVDKAKPMLKESLCGDPEYAPLFPVMCHGARTTRTHTTSQTTSETKTTGEQGKSTGGYGHSTSRYGTSTQHTTTRAPTTRTGKGYPTSGRRDETSSSKIDRVTTTTEILSTSEKSRHKWSTTAMFKSPTRHSNVSGTSNSSTLPQKTSTQDPGRGHITASTRPTATDNGDARSSSTNLRTRSSSSRSSIPVSISRIHGPSMGRSTRPGGFGRLTSTTGRRSTSTARPTASSGKKSDSMVQPSRSTSASTSSISHGRSVTKSQSNVRGGFSRLTSTASLPSASLSSSATTPTLSTGTNKASNTWDGIQSSTTLGYSKPSKQRSTRSQLGSSSRPRTSSSSSRLLKSSLWTDRWDTETYQSTIKSSSGSISMTYSLTGTSSKNHISDSAEKPIASSTETSPRPTKTSRADDLPFSSDTKRKTSSHHWSDITLTEMPTWSTLQPRVSSTRHMGRPDSDGPMVTRTRPEWPKELTGTITVWPLNTTTSLAKRSSPEQREADVPAAPPARQGFGYKNLICPQ